MHFFCCIGFGLKANNSVMKKKWLKIFVLLCFGAVLFSSCSLFQTGDASVDMTPRKIASQTDLQAEEVVQSVKSAVVGISAHSSNGTSVGSGVAIEDGGFILTNHHVVNGAKSILVYFADKTQSTASFVWSDASLDLAIIKSAKNMPFLECGNSKDLKVGQDVLAIGTPLTLQFKHTVTKGIVSALNRTLEVGGISDVNYLQNLIQHDASINPGNSGGPLISMDCKVVGINTLKASESEGIGFAIPIEVGFAIGKQVIENQKTTSAYVGLFGFDAQIASFYNQTTVSEGVYVLSVDEKSPASKCGIKEGDVVVQIDDKPIKTVLDFKVAMYMYETGDPMTIKILRNGKEILMQLNAGKRV
jgi:serine protease Do